MAIYLGVDGGGSKTAALLVDESMHELGTGLAGPSNHLRVGMADATRNIERAVNLALVEANVPFAAIQYAYCGVAGSDHPEHREKVVESLRIFFPRNNFTVDSDARVALTGAVGFEAGIVIVAGTGSVSFGRNTHGAEARSGGWGPTLGDEGSGYAIGRDGLSAVVRAFDGRGPVTRMTNILCDHFGECHPEDLPKFVYAPSTHADDIAVYCKMVIEAAENGDALARGILEDAGRELARSVVAVATRLGMLETAFPVAYVGGAFHAGRFVLDPLEKWLEHHAPEATLQTPLRPPVEGAAMMAIRAAKDPRPGR
jgi:N-acetylglucosamine kinase-like BadF-type ATPase